MITAQDERLRELVERHEGRRYFAYLCPSGKISIGVGRNIEELGLSDSEVSFLFHNDIERCIAELLGFKWFKELSEVRQAAMVDMNFNMGMSRFSKFKKLFDALSRHDYREAAMQMLDSKWARQVPERARGLAFMMMYDTYPRE
jgi:lysozyme